MYSNYQQLPAAGSAMTGETVVMCNYDQAVQLGGQFPQGKVIRGVLAIANSAAAIVQCTIKVRGIPVQTVASPAQGNTPLAAGTTSNLGNYTQVGGSAQEHSLAASGFACIPFSFQDNSGVDYAYYMVNVLPGTGGDLTANDGYMEIFAPEPYGTSD
jgi:hypothetical protein